MTLKHSILQVNDAKCEPVEVPEWKCTIHVRSLSGAERALLQAKYRDIEKSGRWSDFVTWVVVLCACEPNGDRLFSNADFEALNTKNGVALERVSTAARKLNGMDKDAVDDAKKD